MIDPVHGFLFEQGGQMVGQLFRTTGITAEWFLDDDTIPASKKLYEIIIYKIEPLQSKHTHFVPMHEFLMCTVTFSKTLGGSAK